MTDLWSGIGAELSKDEGEWLYRVGSDVRGPSPQSVVVEKLISGEIDLSTMVAREGTDFAPIGQVRAFEQHIRAAKKARAQRAAAKLRRRLIMVAVPVTLVVAGVSLALVQEYKNRVKLEHERLVAAKRAQAQAIAAAPPQELPKMGLVALVSLGTKEDVKISRAPADPEAVAAARAKRKAARLARTHEGPEGPEDSAPAPAAQEEDEMVQSCKLSQQDIFGTLRNHLATINVCVEDEKKRDTENLLPPKLELSFVIKQNGKVVDFLIDDRHYRSGPLNNCMIKAFNSIAFPASTGANCPVTIPIKISK